MPPWPWSRVSSGAHVPGRGGARVESSSLDELGLDDGSADEVRAMRPGETYGVGAGGSAAWQITRLW